MGVLRDKKTLNYYIRVKHNGRDYEKVIGKDKRAAEIALAEIKNEIRMSKHIGQGWQGFAKMQKAAKPKTFNEAADDYMEERADKKPSTLAQYNSILKGYLRPEYGQRNLKEITASELRKFQSRIALKLSARRVNSIMQLVRSILDQAFNEGDIERDPARRVKRRQEPRADVNPLSEDELALALSTIDEHYRPIFTCLAYTGARPNELQALRWSDINWVKKVIRINKGRVRGNEGLPKTKSSEREIPMVPYVVDTLQQLKETRKERSKVRSIDQDNEHVFTRPNGQPIDKHLDRIWARALRKAELAHRPSYQLRHTFATQCIIKGLPIPYVSKVLGHSTMDTTIRHYARWIDAATQANDDRLRDTFDTPKAVKLVEQATG